MGSRNLRPDKAISATETIQSDKIKRPNSAPAPSYKASKTSFNSPSPSYSKPVEEKYETPSLSFECGSPMISTLGRCPITRVTIGNTTSPPETDTTPKTKIDENKESQKGN